MSVDARVESLRMKHAELEAVLQVESRRPVPDPEFVSDIKRRKLRLKDEIARMAAYLH